MADAIFRFRFEELNSEALDMTRDIAFATACPIEQEVSYHLRQAANHAELMRDELEEARDSVIDPGAKAHVDKTIDELDTLLDMCQTALRTREGVRQSHARAEDIARVAERVRNHLNQARMMATI
jgi:hypothetical protein